MNAASARSGLVLLGGVLLSGAAMARADWPAPPENIQQHVIEVGGDDSGAEVVRRDMETAGLYGKGAFGPNPERESATKEGGYLLCGDLFGTGGRCALYEPKTGTKPGSPTLALAEYVDAEWKLRGVWRMPIDWIPQDKRWSGPQNPYANKDSLHLPFMLKDVIADDTPEVIVTGERGKYHQARYVMKFDKGTRGLDLLAVSSAEPVKVGTYLRTYRTSGNKAVWQEWTFMEWKDGALSEHAVWHSESPYNNEDPPFYTAWVARSDGRKENFRINFLNGPEVIRDGKPFAKLKVKWNTQDRPRDFDLIQGAWLFEKITGLPRLDFPERHGPEEVDKETLERLEDHATVEVETAASKEARARFSTSK